MDTLSREQVVENLKKDFPIIYENLKKSLPSIFLNLSGASLEEIGQFNILINFTLSQADCKATLNLLNKKPEDYYLPN